MSSTNPLPGKYRVKLQVISKINKLVTWNKWKYDSNTFLGSDD
jgi:hypothetical protein